jgi:hypothetical protein
MRTTITRILDIPKMDLPDTFVSSLHACSCYEDNVEQQHIYNSFDLLNNGLFAGVFNKANKTILQEIEALCLQNECTYFRLTY